MFLLRQLPVRGVCRISHGDTFKKSAKLRNYVRSTLSKNSHILTPDKNITNSCHNKVICCKYSSEASEKAEVLEVATGGSAVTTDAVFEEIAGGDPQMLRKLKMLEFEVEVLRHSEKNVPSIIKKKEWEYMLTLNSVSGRRKYLVFLFKNEKRSENQRKKKMIQREEFLKKKEEEGVSVDPMEYSLNGQCLFMRIYRKSLNQALAQRINEETAQHVVFDCSYQEYMNSFNSRLCAIQLQYCYNLTIYHRYPCFVRLCNLKKEDYLAETLPKYIVNMYEYDFPWETHESSYLDLYPKEKLVYLTPHCNEPLQKLQPGDVYIIGAFVDKGIGVKASLARAKKNNIRMAKLPLDDFVRWRQGTKSLPLNLVLKILLDMKLYRDWNTALKNLPRRHLNDLKYDVNIDNTHDLLV